MGRHPDNPCAIPGKFPTATLAVISGHTYSDARLHHAPASLIPFKIPANHYRFIKPEIKCPSRTGQTGPGFTTPRAIPGGSAKSGGLRRPGRVAP